LVTLTLLFFTGLFYNLPNAILASVVLVAVSGLVDIKEPIALWKKDRADFFMLMATFLLTLTLGIETGIITGLVLSLVMVIYRASRPHMAELGRVPGTKIFRNLTRFSDLEQHPEVLVVRIDGPIYFANVAFIKSKMDKWAARKGEALKMIVFNMESVTQLDSTGAHELHEWFANWRKASLDVCISNVKGPVRDVLDRWGLITELGSDHMFLDDETALAYFDQRLDAEEMKKRRPYATQVGVLK
jgi:SulP family sulfate permease